MFSVYIKLKSKVKGKFLCCYNIQRQKESAETLFWHNRLPNGINVLKEKTSFTSGHIFVGSLCICNSIHLYICSSMSLCTCNNLIYVNCWKRTLSSAKKKRLRVISAKVGLCTTTVFPRKICSS